MGEPRFGYVIAMNKVTEHIAIRRFENTGNGELDYDEVLDAVCYEVGWNSVWAVHYGALTLDKVSEIVSGLRAYANGGDEAWCDYAESLA